MKRSILAAVAILGIACHRTQDNATAFTWSRDLIGGTLRIRNTNGSVTVVPSPNGKTARVTAATHWRKGNPERDVTFAAVVVGNDATICAHWGEGTCTATEYSSRRKRGLLGIFARRTDARVDFTVEVPAGMHVDVSSVNGSVAVTAQSPVKARTVNGSVNVATAIGPVQATTVNGDVDARMTTLGEPGDVRAETTNGSASAYVPASIDAAATIRTANGKLNTWFPLTAAGVSKRKLEGVLGAGGRTINVKSTNGSVTLGALDASGKEMAKQVP